MEAFRAETASECCGTSRRNQNRCGVSRCSARRDGDGRTAQHWVARLEGYRVNAATRLIYLSGGAEGRAAAMQAKAEAGKAVPQTPRQGASYHGPRHSYIGLTDAFSIVHEALVG